MIKGLFNKYSVKRMDGKDMGPYFVLEYKKDPHARVALEAYINSCKEDHPELANDLRAELKR